MTLSKGLKILKKAGITGAKIFLIKRVVLVVKMLYIYIKIKER